MDALYEAMCLCIIKRLENASVGSRSDASDAF